MEYAATRVREEFCIKKLVTVHYAEYSKDFVFAGEKHDFWEMVYVDKGEIDVISNESTRRLHQGDLIFHKPNEWHQLRCNGIAAPNLAIVSFLCSSPMMQQFENGIYRVDGEQKALISKLIYEASRAYTTPLDDLTARKLRKRKSMDFGCEQLIVVYLTELFIKLARSNGIAAAEKAPLSVLTQRRESDIIGEISDYLARNIDKKLSFDDVATYANISKTSIKLAFQKKIHMGVMSYFNQLKIERAKAFIREDNYNITQIANLLGYDSIHYFSKQFKRIVHMTPTEYAQSIRSIMENE